jgi:hypothetical protein
MRRAQSQNLWMARRGFVVHCCAIKRLPDVCLRHASEREIILARRTILVNPATFGDQPNTISRRRSTGRATDVDQSRRLNTRYRIRISYTPARAFPHDSPGKVRSGFRDTHYAVCDEPAIAAG